MDSDLRLDKALLFYRERYRITQKDLAEMCGVSRKLVSEWESTRVVPRIQYVKPICKALQIDPNTLFQWGE